MAVFVAFCRRFFLLGVVVFLMNSACVYSQQILFQDNFNSDKGNELPSRWKLENFRNHKPMSATLVEDANGKCLLYKCEETGNVLFSLYTEPKQIKDDNCALRFQFRYRTTVPSLPLTVGHSGNPGVALPTVKEFLSDLNADGQWHTKEVIFPAAAESGKRRVLEFMMGSDMKVGDSLFLDDIMALPVNG